MRSETLACGCIVELNMAVYNGKIVFAGGKISKPCATHKPELERSKDEIEKALALLESDVRFKLPPARLDINGATALEQVSLKARRDVLRWVLGLTEDLYIGEHTGDL